MKSPSVILFACAAFTFLLPSSEANAGTQYIYASTNNPGGIVSVSVPSTVKCTSATGGTNVRCYIHSPGYNRLLQVGESAGTSGAGNVQLDCTGTRPPNGVLSCTAEVTDTACAASQLATATRSGGNIYSKIVPISKSATIQCNTAYGGTYGTKCLFDAPGYYGTLNVGQSAVTSGAGTVIVDCSGAYSVPNGGLTCTAGITQSCP